MEALASLSPLLDCQPVNIERHGWQVLTSLWLLAASACHERSKRAQSPEPDPSAAVNREYVSPDAQGWGRVAGLRYLEKLKGGAQTSDRIPMAVFLHGYGSEGAQDVWLYNAKVPMRAVMFESPRKFGDNYTWMYSPINEGNTTWLGHTVQGAGEELARAIKLLAAHRPTRGRVIIAGFSQGAVLTYYLATHHPDQVYGAAPIAGLLPKPLWPEKLTASHPAPAIRAIHGAQDNSVFTASAEQSVAYLAKLGQPATLHVYPNVGHRLTPTMREEMQVQVESFAREIMAPSPPSATDE